LVKLRGCNEEFQGEKFDRLIPMLNFRPIKYLQWQTEGFRGGLTVGTLKRAEGVDGE
jgi:hypothetical protein